MMNGLDLDVTKSITVELPVGLLLAVAAHFEKHHLPISELIHQSLEYRLTCKTWPPAEGDVCQQKGLSSQDADVIARIADILIESGDFLKTTLNGACK